MLSMGHPDYRYRPWSAERRQRASAAAKRRWAEKRGEPRASDDKSFRVKYASGSPEWQMELMQCWLRLVVLYRESPTEPKFQNMLADCLEDMASVLADSLRQ